MIKTYEPRLLDAPLLKKRRITPSDARAKCKKVAQRRAAKGLRFNVEKQVRKLVIHDRIEVLKQDNFSFSA